jgi:hypothetical protein
MKLPTLQKLEAYAAHHLATGKDRATVTSRIVHGIDALIEAFGDERDEKFVDTFAEPLIEVAIERAEVALQKAAKVEQPPVVPPPVVVASPDTNPAG